MIKVGILGGECETGGELLRLLVNHPDVVLKQCSGKRNVGKPVQDIHYGLIGETELHFSQKLDFDKLDAVFVCEDSEESHALFESADNYPELRIIDLTRTPHPGKDGYVFGLSEIYRKPMVRGAKRAVLPYPEESAALIMLYPLAANLVLDGDIDIDITMPEERIPAERLADSGVHIANHLRLAQMSFNGNIRFNPTVDTSSHSVIRIHVELPLSMSYEDILSFYDNIYDDHNFTFMVRGKVSEQEVAGTNKCIISISKPAPERAEIEAVIDGNMRGGAGEALHAFNLLFGLHERTALALKAIYDR